MTRVLSMDIRSRLVSAVAEGLKRFAFNLVRIRQH